jgi:hypothetical protein
MFVDNCSVQNEVAALAASACAELFDAYGIRLTPVTGYLPRSEEPMISGVMGFVGPNIRGTLLMASERGPLMASRPCEGRLRDWAGELANQIVGQLKNKLLARGTDLALSVPVVLQGIRVEPLPKNESAPSVFTAGNGLVMVWVEIETLVDYVLDPEGPSQSAALGEIQVF